MPKIIPARLPDVLLPWYREHKRDLPWRKDRVPYHIWVSEIMLQQTRVEAVKDYYTRFLDALPTIDALADCEDEKLAKLWEGLGYYSRVRNMKKAAQLLRDRWNSKFPESYEQVLSLPGVGAYTAGAICSIAFDLPAPAVDGNVLRVISRLTNDPTPIDLPQTKQQVRAGLEAIYPAQAGDFTQALMELGATLCGPNRSPDCEKCPCCSLCLGFSEGTAQMLPVKSPRKEKKQEARTVFIASCDGKYALQKRPDSGLLAGLWQFPNVPGTLDIPQALEAAQELGLKPRQLLRQSDRSHIFTHIRWNMRGIYLEAAECAEAFCWFTPEEIREKAALPTAFRQFWEDMHYV